MNKKQVGVYGAGGSGREVAWLISRLAKLEQYEFVGYIDDSVDNTSCLNGSPVYSLTEFVSRHKAASVALGVGGTAVRKALAEKCTNAGLVCQTLIDPSVQISDSILLGKGVIICASTIVTVDIEIADYVQINYGCTIAHDVRIGAYSTVSPGVNVSGNVHIGEGVFIGAGASIVNGTPDKPLVLGDGCAIGAGACVTASTKERSLYVGVPARFKNRC